MTPPTSTQLRIVHEAGLRTRLVSGPRKNATKKRICAEPGCKTPLSRYNEGTKCSQHGGWPASPVSSYEYRDAFAEALDGEAA